VSSARSAIVIKLGGSLIESGRIARTLEIVGNAQRPCIVVPGGGAFADAVRAAQKAYHFDDAAAHRMAVLAMEQSALLLAALNSRLVLASSAAAIRTALAETSIPVWMPCKMVLRDKRIAMDWTTTSDSLAAHLAARLGGLALALVKSTPVPPGATAVQLAEAGIVDAAFAGIVEQRSLNWRVLGPQDEPALIDLLASVVPSSRRRGADRAIARQRR